MTSLAIIERKVDTLIMQIEIAKVVHRYAHLGRAKNQKILRKIHSRVFELVECLHSIDTEIEGHGVTKFKIRIDAHISDLKAYMRSLDITPRYKHPLHKQSESVQTSLP